MTVSNDTPQRVTLVAVDIAKNYHDVLVQPPTPGRRRRVRVANSRLPGAVSFAPPFKRCELARRQRTKTRMRPQLEKGIKPDSAGRNQIC